MSSQIDQILLDAKGVVDGLALTLSSTAVPCVVGKAPVHRRGVTPDTQITVAKSETPERVTRWRFGKVRVDWFFDVTFVTPHTSTEGGQTDDLDDHGVIREALLDAFDKPPLGTNTDVFDVRSRAKEFLDREAQQKEYDEQTIEVTASTIRST